MQQCELHHTLSDPTTRLQYQESFLQIMACHTVLICHQHCLYEEISSKVQLIEDPKISSYDKGHKSEFLIEKRHAEKEKNSRNLYAFAMHHKEKLEVRSIFHWTCIPSLVEGELGRT